LVQPYQRYSVYTALIDCAENTKLLGNSFISDLAGFVIPALVVTIDKETDENNMLIGAVCLGKWIGHELNLTCLESIKNGLNKSKNHIQAYLIALTIGLKDNSELSSGLLVLLSVLTNIVKEGVKKPSNQAHYDAVLAYHLLLQMSTR
jgi:hypothetical protein